MKVPKAFFVVSGSARISGNCVVLHGQHCTLAVTLDGSLASSGIPQGNNVTIDNVQFFGHVPSPVKIGSMVSWSPTQGFDSSLRLCVNKTNHMKTHTTKSHLKPMQSLSETLRNHSNLMKEHASSLRGHFPTKRATEGLKRVEQLQQNILTLLHQAVSQKEQAALHKTILKIMEEVTKRDAEIKILQNHINLGKALNAKLRFKISQLKRVASAHEKVIKTLKKELKHKVANNPSIKLIEKEIHVIKKRQTGFEKEAGLMHNFTDARLSVRLLKATVEEDRRKVKVQKLKMKELQQNITEYQKSMTTNAGIITVLKWERFALFVAFIVFVVAGGTLICYMYTNAAPNKSTTDLVEPLVPTNAHEFVEPSAKYEPNVSVIEFTDNDGQRVKCIRIEAPGRHMVTHGRTVRGEVQEVSNGIRFKLVKENDIPADVEFTALRGNPSASGIWERVLDVDTNKWKLAETDSRDFDMHGVWQIKLVARGMGRKITVVPDEYDHSITSFSSTGGRPKYKKSPSCEEGDRAVETFLDDSPAHDFRKIE